MSDAAAYRLSHPEFLRLSPAWPKERTLFDGLSARTYLTGELGYEILRVLADGERALRPDSIADQIDPGGARDTEFVGAVTTALIEFERLGLVTPVSP